MASFQCHRARCSGGRCSRAAGTLVPVPAKCLRVYSRSSRMSSYLMGECGLKLNAGGEGGMVCFNREQDDNEDERREGYQLYLTKRGKKEMWMAA